MRRKPEPEKINNTSNNWRSSDNNNKNNPCESQSSSSLEPTLLTLSSRNDIGTYSWSLSVASRPFSTTSFSTPRAVEIATDPIYIENRNQFWHNREASAASSTVEEEVFLDEDEDDNSYEDDSEKEEGDRSLEQEENDHGEDLLNDKKSKRTTKKRSKASASKTRASTTSKKFGFDQVKWMEHYEKLKKYKEQHGDCFVKNDDDDENESRLHTWVYRQRVMYKESKEQDKQELRKNQHHVGNNENYQNANGRDDDDQNKNDQNANDVDDNDSYVARIAKERIQLLLDIGFEFNPQDIKWHQK
eukprot:CAMPEP_0198151696 /NCGR_PEP_ID=MMETSP1443-20131203/56695_1 /TAXON_ID=186043 /ORGANISM="Entomoneis sp., Strain CCMP2396" /LENGTH=301 /DNA_ID=CAMNT_0043817463 /DNA_START=228 /DNA_END=1130 /DNA_ORIENTATION=-